MTTIGDTLSAKGVSWAWYAGAWNAALRDGMQDPAATRQIIYNNEAGHPYFVAHHQPFNYFARFAPGTKVVIRPGPDADIQARMLDGRRATVERILTDYDGKVHLGVTVDDDPGRDLLRETGRFLYFFAPEVEVIDT